jgi:DNA/RNA endonuclease YhcR with UshA esterase domain
MLLIRVLAIGCLLALCVPFNASADDKAPAPETAADPLVGAVDVSLVTSEMIGTTKAIRGRILDIIPSTHPRMPKRLVIRRDPQFSVIYFPDVAGQIEKQLGEPKVGMWVYARGPVGEWRNLVELRVAKGGAIKFFAPESEASTLPVVIETVEALEAVRFTAPRVAMKDFDSHLEKPVSVLATVERYELPSSERAPHVLRVTDGTGNIDVVFWDIAPDVDRRAMVPGSKLEIQGTAGRYRDRQQLRVRDARDIRVAGAPDPSAPLPAMPTLERVPISTLGQRMGDKVLIEGRVASITEPWSDRAPHLLRIEDASGAVEVVFWDALKPKLNADLLRENARVRVTGEVAQHLGKTQIRLNEPEQLSAAQP